MGPGRILITDIDGTLVGDDAALQRFATWLAEDCVSHRLVYATGRHRESLEQLMAETALPEPDAVITAVGTEIHDRYGQAWRGWSERFVGYDADVVRRALRGAESLILQPADAQTRLKASYHADELPVERIAEIGAMLVSTGLDTRLVYSGQRNLDVLPAGAGKGSAARFLVDEWDAAPDTVMVFGDTGNDLDLFGNGFLETVVGNALPELTDVVADRAYRSPFRYAAGVLDGIWHWSMTGQRSPDRGRRAAHIGLRRRPAGRARRRARPERAFDGPSSVARGDDGPATRRGPPRPAARRAARGSMSAAGR